MTGQPYEDLPKGLRAQLEKANEMCETLGGRLESRQAVAVIVVPYMVEAVTPYTVCDSSVMRDQVKRPHGDGS